MTGQGNVLGTSTTTVGVGSTAAVLAGAAVLPNTGNNVLITILSMVTIAVGVVVLTSMIASRLLVKYYAT